MSRFNLQVQTRVGAMNVARLSKVETGRAGAADSTLGSRATRRFMGSDCVLSAFNDDNNDTY